MVTNARADIFCGNGIGPLAKWVKDHIFFRIPCNYLARYNIQCAEWQEEVKVQVGYRQECGRVWYRGKELPSGQPEFDKECAMPLVTATYSDSRQDSKIECMKLSRLGSSLQVRLQHLV